MDLSAIIPTFLITLREGVEAALVVGIVLAYLKQAGQLSLQRWVYGGIAAGLLGSVLIGLCFTGALWWMGNSRPDTAAFKPLMEAGFAGIAIGLLSWMLIWMTQQAKLLKRSIEGEIERVITADDGAAWGIFGIIFLAVLREGFETVVFIAAQFQQGWLPPIGALLGLVGATLIGTLLFKWGVRINLQRFFQVMGVALLLIVGGLAVGMLAHLDQGIARLAEMDDRWQSLCFTTDAGSCLLGPLVWDLGAILPDRRFPGIILKTLLGYRDRLYGLELISYVGLLASVGWAYFSSLSVPSSRATPSMTPNNSVVPIGNKK
ncbi:FTR1 family iron permease [filamentous cyanobacterium LEGE 11480]|uniref:FTR1 family iron permease n=1 Tax=Romeriopsis navalis LEGE 11480 TaxID=2777977 RepID=A0A928VP74_9CYAN|nr:FTR1 family protein [Romeriopsis navalis]MBE9029514.1 FTR1 family iron permease [Romeriopsis navalis LEGE 11480]